MAGQEATIGALGIVIFAGLLGRLFLKKTGISDVFLLMLFGVASGFALPSDALEGLHYLLLPLGAFALFMIIFDAGLHLRVSSLTRYAHSAALFSALSFSLSFALSFLLGYVVWGFDLFFSLLLSAIFASVTPELLSGFLTALGASETAKGIGELEATISDAVSVVLALLLISLAEGGRQFSFSGLPVEIAFIIAISAALGSAFALVWKVFIRRLAESNEHLIAIGVAAILYAASGHFGANGVVSVLVFGFFLGNSSKGPIEEIRHFQSGISFFLRTFFLVYLGILLSRSPFAADAAAFALALSVLFACARLISGRLISFLEPSARPGRLLELVSCRGLTPAILSVIASEELFPIGAKVPLDLPLLALFVVFFTNLVSAMLVFRKSRRHPGNVAGTVPQVQ